MGLSERTPKGSKCRIFLVKTREAVHLGGGSDRDVFKARLMSASVIKDLTSSLDAPQVEWQ